MKMDSLLCGAMVVAVVFAAAAEDQVYDETTGFVTCVKNGYIGDSAIWSDATGFPNAQTNYYIGAQRTVSSPKLSNTITFSPTLYVAGKLKAIGGAADSTTLTDVHMLPGSQLSVNNVPSWKGKMTIETPTGTDPVTYDDGRGDASYPVKFNMAVVGNAEARLNITRSSSYVRLMERSGDWSQFYGACTVANNFKITSNANFTLPGTLTFGDNCIYSQSNTSRTDTFGSLAFGDSASATFGILTVNDSCSFGANGTLSLKSGSSFGTLSIGAGTTVDFVDSSSVATVATKLELGDGVSFGYTISSRYLNNDHFLPFLCLSPACVTAGLPSLEKIAVHGLEYMPSDFKLEYRDNPKVEGGKILGATYTEIVWYKLGKADQADSSGNSQEFHNSKHYFIASGVETNAWSDGLSPHAGCVYYTSSHMAVCSYCNVPDVMIMNGPVLYINGTCKCPDWRMVGGTAYVRYGSGTFKGKFGLFAEKQNFRTYMDKKLTVNSDLYGGGGIDFDAYYPTASAISQFYLYGNNSKWSGGLWFTMTTESGKTPLALDENVHVKVYVNNSESLGGTTATFAYNKLQLNDYAEIIATADANFTNACRGVYVKDNGALSVNAGKTVRFAAPVTMGGFARLRKNGAGKLVLGSPLRFLSGTTSVANPCSQTNYFVDVTAGAMAVTDCNALNGAKVAFSNDTVLAIAADVAAGDLKKYGLRLDKVAAPLATDVSVRIVADSLPTVTTLTLGLVTVASADAETVTKKLSVANTLRGYRLTSVAPVADAASGTVTFTATLERRGLMMILR